MTLEEFRNNLNNNESDIVEELNRHISGLSASPSSTFGKDETYSFSWTSLTNELSERHYSFSKKQKKFVKDDESETEEKTSKRSQNKMMQNIINNINKKTICKSKQITIRLEENILQEIDELIKDNAEYARTEFISDIIKWGLEEIKTTGGIRL